MNMQRPQTSWIIAGALVACSLILASAVKSFGRSLENAASSISQGMTMLRPTDIPSSIRLNGDFEVNSGRSGQALRIETTEKQAKN
jgi:hypothetical protein